MGPDEAKRIFTCCIKGLEQFELPASCETWSDIYKNCGTLAMSGATGVCEAFDFAEAELHWPKAFTVFLKKTSEAYPAVVDEKTGSKIRENAGRLTRVTEDNLLERIGTTFYLLLICAANLTDEHFPSQKACCEDGFIKFLLHELLPKLHNVEWTEPNIRKEILRLSMGLIYNCCRIDVNIPYYEEYNAVDILVMFKNETDHLEENSANIHALFTLAHLINDKNNDIIVPNSQSIENVLSGLSCAVTGSGTSGGFHAYELADALTQMAVNDKNKAMICDAGGADVFLEMLQEVDNDKERISACKALWTICFVQQGREAVSKLPEILKIANELKLSKNYDLRNAAEGLLWQMKVDDHVAVEESHSESSSNPKSRAGHVMISYQWDNQDIVLELSNTLKKRGYNIWIDVDRMEGSIMEAMADAVEKAEVVLVCISRKYKLSQNCRAEAEYAFQRHKTIIPLMMEKSFTPDGWLGILMGSKLWIGFTEHEETGSQIVTLVKHIGSKGLKGDESIVSTEEVEFSLIPGGSDEQPGHGHHPVECPQSDHFDAVDSVDRKAKVTQNQQGIFGKRVTMDPLKKNEVSKWRHEKVLEWLRENEMEGFIKKSQLKTLMGFHLVTFYQLRYERPELYYNCLRVELGFPKIVDFLAFHHHLETLFEED